MPDDRLNWKTTYHMAVRPHALFSGQTIDRNVPYGGRTRLTDDWQKQNGDMTNSQLIDRVRLGRAVWENVWFSFSTSWPRAEYFPVQPGQSVITEVHNFAIGLQSSASMHSVSLSLLGFLFFYVHSQNSILWPVEVTSSLKMWNMFFGQNVSCSKRVIENLR